MMRAQMPYGFRWKGVLLILCGLLFSAPLLAGIKKVPGKITVNGVTQNVTIKLPVDGKNLRKLWIQIMLKYIDENGNKAVLEPGDAEQITFNYRGTDYKLVSRIVEGYGMRFVRVRSEGPLNTYYYVYRSYAPGVRYNIETLAIGTADKKLIVLRTETYKDELKAYFSDDCPNLAKAVAEGRYTWNTLDDAVLYYNQKCADR